MAIAKKTITDENDVVSNPLNSNGTVNCSNIVATAIEKDIGSVTLVIKGSGTAWNEAKDTEFYVTGYVTDGSNLQYFTTNASASLSSLATVTYSQYA
jgi:predicted nucleic acid-binding Zn ribbon protein